MNCLDVSAFVERDGSNHLLMTRDETAWLSSDTWIDTREAQ